MNHPSLISTGLRDTNGNALSPTPDGGLSVWESGPTQWSFLAPDLEDPTSIPVPPASRTDATVQYVLWWVGTILRRWFGRTLDEDEDENGINALRRGLRGYNSPFRSAPPWDEETDGRDAEEGVWRCCLCRARHRAYWYNPGDHVVIDSQGNRVGRTPG